MLRSIPTVVLYVLSSNAMADVFVAQSATNPANGHQYHLLVGNATGAGRHAGVSWPEASAFAQSQWGASLATINDAAENNWILNTFRHHNDVAISTGDSYHFRDGRVGILIGYNDQAIEGLWQWSGEPSSYENWRPGSPDGNFNQQFDLADFALMTPFGVNTDPSLWGTWHDVYLRKGPVSDGGYLPYYGLAEVVPELLSGDFDGDNMVTIFDLNLVLFNWNVDGSEVFGPWTSERPPDGTPVGLEHLNAVLFNWGDTVSVATVPEPAAGTLSVWMFVLGLTPVVASGRQSRAASCLERLLYGW
jgi:hypothetical protein